MAAQKKRDEEDEETFREDEELSVLRYNQALLCLQLRQHVQAALILEDLFVNIEPIDDFLAIKICFLLLELCLIQREPELAVGVLAYLEKPNAFMTVFRTERQKEADARVVGDDAELLAETAKDVEDGGEDTGDPPEPIETPAVIEKVAPVAATAPAVEETPER